MNIFQSIRQQNPIVQCLTNLVSANFQANGLLAVGASPIMSDSIEECREVVERSHALSINLGTLNAKSLAIMLTAGKLANDFNIPVVLDPVGAGFTQYRTESTLKILESFQVHAIRCNYGEFAALSGIPWQSIGVDAGQGELAQLKNRLIATAKKYNCILAVTGAEDMLASSEELIFIEGGNPLITEVTASGCLLSSICAAALASQSNPIQSIHAALTMYKQCAHVASQNSAGRLGNFHVDFVNQLHYFSLGN